MKALFLLTVKSILNRKLTSGLTILTIALSFCLLISVERIRSGAKEGFSNTISQTDLIVGAKGGTVQLLLYTVFRIGSPTDNISYETYEHFKNHSAVEWTIPYSLGDSHRGYRVVGTNEDFFAHYRFYRDRHVEFAGGQPFSALFEVVLGAEVAEKLAYKLDDKMVLAHGVAEVSLQNHEDKPFQVVGILKRTGTPIDRSLYISLKSLEAIHLDWQDGAPPMPGEERHAEDISADELELSQITSFLLRTKNRIETLTLQREINNYPEEALMAIIPGVALSDMWDALRFAEQALILVSVFVVIVGLLGMVIALYNSLSARRREMAILRSLGAVPGVIASLLIFESFILALLGVLVGGVLSFLLLVFFQPVIANQFGLYLMINPPSVNEYLFAGSVLVLGLVLGFLPAMRAYLNTLSDGLTPKI